LIEERFLEHRRRSQLAVYLNGKKLPIKHFVQDFLMGGILGMLSTLRGYEVAETMDIHIRMEGHRK
jgi:molybdopterin-guanine dinucleotide biosynthesis protein B